MRFWRIVFQVNSGQTLLYGAENFIGVFKVIFWCLIDDQVKIKVLDLLGRYLMYICGKVKSVTPTAVSLGASRFYGQVPIMIDTGQGIEIAAVNVPDQNF